jgi:GH15 family glucan-1,4-alpha-glucosidase
VDEPHALRDYALIADGERGALIGPHGDLAWLCFPSWADAPVFASLLGGGGEYVVQPDARHVWGGFYEPGSLIWRSRWITEDAIVECREALALPSRRDRAVVLRRIEGVEGSVRMRVRLRTADVRFAWTGTAPEFEVGVRAGERVDLVLVLGADELPDADESWRRTEAEWRERAPELPAAEAGRDAQHALAVLAGLTAASGATVAAATTALPERAEEGRSYDYRYAWIRDQCLVGHALRAAGRSRELMAAVGFIRDRVLEHGPRLAPAYTVDGGAIPSPGSLGLPGYPGGTDVVGNHVNEQFQLDGYGEALQLLAAAADDDLLAADGWRAAEVAADAIAERWREPEAGIWELSPARWTHSRLTCAAGLRAIAEHAPRAAHGERWRDLARALLDEAGARGVHPSGRWRRAYDDDRVDAALLLPQLRSPTDPRAEATLRAVRDELCDDGYVYRYHPDERPLGEAEGAFLLCGFALALALLARGDRYGALRVFERNRAACGPPGLLAEEFDVRQRQLRGNLPQAFVHALLLECAVRLGPSSVS